MKRIFRMLILILFTISLSGSISAQRYTTNETYQVKQNDSIYTFQTHFQLIPYLDDLFENLLDANVDISRLKNFEGIFIYQNLSAYYGWAVWGLYERGFFQEDVIYISSELQPYLPTFVSAIIYHEFYHLFSQAGHCIKDDTDESMMQSLIDYFKGFTDCPYILQSGDKIDPEVVIRFWNKVSKQDYIRYLKYQMENP